MEFTCKRLQVLLESLVSDRELRSWTVHDNKFGTSVTIRFSNVNFSTREKSFIPTAVSSSTPTSHTRDSENAPGDADISSANAGETPEDLAMQDSDHTRNAPSDISGSLYNRRKFKPSSDYQLKRDQQRLESFKNRCTTRSQSDTEHVELKRDSDDSDSACSTPCISPVKTGVSPWADENPYSLLQVTEESPVPSKQPAPVQNEDNDDVEEELYDAQPSPAPSRVVGQQDTRTLQQIFNEATIAALANWSPTFPASLGITLPTIGTALSHDRDKNEEHDKT